MRIGLFTEQDSRARGSLAATIDALIAHRPDDASIIEYSRPANLESLRGAREQVSHAAADRIDVVHVATTAPFAMIALFVAWRFGLPVIGFIQPHASSTRRMFMLMRARRQTRRCW